MAWIESHEELSRHPKTRKAARALGVSIPAVLGHLHCLWHDALGLAEDGDLSRWSSEDIATSAMWDADPQEFVDALVDCGMGGGVGFLERGGAIGDPTGGRVGELVIHDWWEYAGRLIARRRADRERKARERAGAATRKGDDVQGTSNGQVTDPPKDSRLEASYRTQPDLTEPNRTEPGVKTQRGSTAADTGQPTLRVVADLWNEECSEHLPRVEKLTEGRRRKVQARSAPDRDESWWRTYFAKIASTPFCTGESERGWLATFDWAVKSEEIVAKVLEGSYERAPPGRGSRRRGALQAIDDLDRAEEEVRRRDIRRVEGDSQATARRLPELGGSG